MGDEHWVGGEGETWQRGKERGASLLEHSQWSHSEEETLMCTGHRVCLLPGLQSAPAPPRTPSKTPSGFGGNSCRTIRTGPALPPSASSPLLSAGSQKVLGWADSGGNSIEFSFGYILKAKVSWTYSQNR